MKTYQHIDESDFHITLHDCRADTISLSENTLTFHFSDGFWISSEHAHNHLGQTVRTDPAEVRFRLCEDEMCGDVVKLHVFTEKKHGKAIRKTWNLKKLMKKINSGQYQLEFMYVYKGYLTVLYDCLLWSKKKPWFRECELRIPTEHADFCWNNLLPDRQW